MRQKTRNVLFTIICIALILGCILAIILGLYFGIKKKSDVTFVEMPHHIQATLSESYKKSQKIPKKIYQTYSTNMIPEEMKEVSDNWRDMNPDYEYYYYIDKDCREFLSKNFDVNVLDAYDALKPGAYKADLWRYCILYIHGGVYVDMGLVAKYPLKDFISEEDEFVCSRDRPKPKNGLYNAFIASTPGNPILKIAIEMCLKNIKDKILYSDFLKLTGPLLLGQAFNYFKYDTIERKKVIAIGRYDVKDIKVNILEVKGSWKIEPFIVLNNTIIIKGKYDGYRRDQKLTNKLHYTTLVKNKNVFNLSPIPKNIFQTHKSKEYIENDPELLKASKSWKDNDYNYYFYSDKDRNDFMKKFLGKENYKYYEQLPLQVMKADFWRYCIIYEYGGIYTDADTICLSNPDDILVGDYNLILVSEPFWTTNLICQWIFAASPKHPALLLLINKILDKLKKGIDLTDKKFVHNYTGPTIFTNSITKWMTDNNYKVNLTNMKKLWRHKYKDIYFHKPSHFHNKIVKHFQTGKGEDGWKKEREKLINLS